jgi:hypothetical protein
MAKSKVAILALVVLAGAGAAVLFGQAPAEDRPAAPPAQGNVPMASGVLVHADRPDDGIAWGKTAGGLRAGIGLRAGDRRTYRADDSVTLVVYLRNVGTKVVGLSHTETLFAEWMPVVLDAADGLPVAVAPGPIHTGDVPIMGRILEPGEQIILGYPWFRVRPPSWRGPIQGPTLRTGPGKYRAGYAGLPLRLEGAAKDASGPPSGWVEFEIEPEDELRGHRAEITRTRTEDNEQVFFVNKADLKIPFTLGRPEDNVRLLSLYVSEDRGASWQLAAKAAPTDKAFNFRAPRDGMFWFAVQAVERSGRADPPDPAKAPHQKICVDTKSPQATLRANRRGREVELCWAVTDENLNRRTLRVEYRPAEQGEEWHALKVPPEAEGKVVLRPGTDGEIEVRLRVADRASNETTIKGMVKAAPPE